MKTWSKVWSKVRSKVWLKFWSKFWSKVWLKFWSKSWIGSCSQFWSKDSIVYFCSQFFEKVLWKDFKNKLIQQLFKNLRNWFLKILVNQLWSRSWIGYWIDPCSNCGSMFLEKSSSKVRSKINSRFWKGFSSQLWSKVWSKINSRFWKGFSSQFSSKFWKGSLKRLQFSTLIKILNWFWSKVLNWFLFKVFEETELNRFWSRFNSQINRRFKIRFF